MKGQILKALSGFYYVKYEDRLIECKARGNIRKGNGLPLTGDYVEFTSENFKTGTIETVYERKNSFIRPSVANVDCFIFVASDSVPVTDPYLIDRLSVIALKSGCEFVLCVNKCDLTDGSELFSLYKNLNFPLFVTSAVNGEGIDSLVSYIKGKTCVLTGNSGVGKSSILNSVCPDFLIPIGEISEKLGRGKHTTRHVQLYDIGENTLVADTPGFASFDITMVSDIDKDELKTLFPEFAEFECNCRYPDCMHINEPFCGVKTAVSNGEIPDSRYDSYIRLYAILKEHKSWD